MNEDQIFKIHEPIDRILTDHHGMVDPESTQAVALEYIKESITEGLL